MLVRLASVLAGHHPDGLDTRARTALVGAVDRAARSGPPTQALLQEIGLAVGRLPRLRFDAATQLRDETSSILAAVVQDWLHHDEGSPQQQREFSNAAEGVLLLLAFWTGGRRLPLPEWSRPLRDAVADGARRRDPGFLAAAAVYLAAFSACPAAAADEREAAWMHAAALITSGVPPGADPHAWCADVEAFRCNNLPTASRLAKPHLDFYLHPFSAGCGTALRGFSPRAATWPRALSRSRESGPPARWLCSSRASSWQRRALKPLFRSFVT